VTNGEIVNPARAGYLVQSVWGLLSLQRLSTSAVNHSINKKASRRAGRYSDLDFDLKGTPVPLVIAGTVTTVSRIVTGALSPPVIATYQPKLHLG